MLPQATTFYLRARLTHAQNTDRNKIVVLFICFAYVVMEDVFKLYVVIPSYKIFHCKSYLNKTVEVLAIIIKV